MFGMSFVTVIWGLILKYHGIFWAVNETDKKIPDDNTAHIYLLRRGNFQPLFPSMSSLCFVGRPHTQHRSTVNTTVIFVPLEILK